MSKSTIFKAAALLAALGATTPAAANLARQFDIVCKGTQTLATGKPATAWTERFRFDLPAKRWCRGKCTTAAELYDVNDDRIVVSDSRATIGGPADSELYLSRTDGTAKEYVRAGYSGRTFGLAEGKCTREYFTGLPGQKF